MSSIDTAVMNFFRVFDMDGSGLIDADEVENYLNS